MPKAVSFFKPASAGHRPAVGSQARCLALCIALLPAFSAAQAEPAASPAHEPTVPAPSAPPAAPSLPEALTAEKAATPDSSPEALQPGTGTFKPEAPSSTAAPGVLPRASGQPDATTSAAPASSTSALLRTLLGLLAVLGLLGGVLWMMRRFGMVQPTGRSVARVIGGVSVGSRERVVVVEVGGQWIVVGVAPGRVNALAQMPAEAGAPVSGAIPAATGASNFSEWLRQTIQQRQDKARGGN